jgi:pimeloyl-ACP methyl ester carboxylesterase
MQVAAAHWPDLLSNVCRHFRNALRLTRDSLVADVTADAARVRVPALVAWGRLDRTMPLRCAEEFVRHLPDPAVYLCGGAAHAWIIRRPDQFAAAVEQFTKGQLAAQGFITSDLRDAYAPDLTGPA